MRLLPGSTQARWEHQPGQCTSCSAHEVTSRGAPWHWWADVGAQPALVGRCWRAERHQCPWRHRLQQDGLARALAGAQMGWPRSLILPASREPAPASCGLAATCPMTALLQAALSLKAPKAHKAHANGPSGHTQTLA